MGRICSATLLYFGSSGVIDKLPLRSIEDELRHSLGAKDIARLKTLCLTKKALKVNDFLYSWTSIKTTDYTCKPTHRRT